jgi:predicted site-specific integrase-resolvase
MPDCGYTRDACRGARFRLQTLAESCGADIREIVVIHGYHGGQALKDMVREE